MSEAGDSVPSSKATSRLATRPTGAARITPPQPLLSLLAGSPMCLALRRADKQVLPGALLDQSAGTSMSHPSVATCQLRSICGSRFGLSPLSLQPPQICVMDHRRRVTNTPATYRVFARSKPSAVNKVICVSSVMAPMRP